MWKILAVTERQTGGQTTRDRDRQKRTQKAKRERTAGRGKIRLIEAIKGAEKIYIRLSRASCIDEAVPLVDRWPGLHSGDAEELQNLC